MFYAENEKDGSRTEMFFEEDDLLDYLGAVSVPGDFWDVYGNRGNGILYYWAP